MKIKTGLILILFVIIFVLKVQVNIARNKVAKLETSKSQSDYTYLATNLKSQIIVENEKIVYKTREGAKLQATKPHKSPDRHVSTTQRYLAPEGKAEINVNLDGHTTISIKSKGLCFKPTISALFDYNGAKLGLGARIAYWNRYGLTTGVSISVRDRDTKPFIAIERRISDILPVIKNTTLGLSYNGSFGVYIGVFF